MRKHILFKDEEISREIERRIGEAHMNEGDRLPSEREMAEEFGVQRDTIRCALEILLKKGVLIRKPRRGYFVAPKRLELNLKDLRSVRKEIENFGLSSDALLLNFEVICMSKRLSEITQMPEGTLCYQILRLRYGEELPVSLERSYIMAEHAPDMSREDLEKHTLGFIMRHNYGISFVSAQHRITQVYPDEMEAELLRISKDEPLIRYEGLLYDKKDRLIEFFDNVALPYCLEFHVREYV